MHGAVFAMVVNIAVAGLFAASFAIIAFTNPSHRSAYGFSISYAIGMLTPASELLLPISGWPEPFMVTSYFSFMAGLLAMAAAIARFYRRPAPWVAIAAIFVAAAVLRWTIWDGERDWLPYELAFQAPFVAASALLCWVLLRTSRRRPLEVAAAMMFGIVALHFFAKPFLAQAFGSGRSAKDYVDSTYALLSQASTGILLTAAGLLMLLVTVQSIVRESQSESQTDPLSGLANRRGFDLHAARVLVRAAELRLPVSVAVFDIDHFKAINDTHGHAVGDEVIRGLADLLRRAAPQAAVIGRMGGEEFALLFEHTNQEGARLNAEAIRIAAETERTGLPPFTVSAGVSVVRPDESLGEAMRRADMALYEAKRQGRNRICVAEATGRRLDDRQLLVS
ncbi:MAG: GGDEF domain-containing protein [Rhizobiales bacterium]|jgi:diguanylate cyclase (GGDEF)-like protein|nr:GGDEF domain-containing protein [Hyphomicrobiales bacterium]